MIPVVVSSSVLAAKFPRVTTTLGSTSRIWASSQGRQAAISSGCGSRFWGGRLFTTFADIDVLAAEADAFQEAVEELAGGADEGEALAVLVEAGGLADEHQVGVGVALAEHDLGAALVEAAAGAAGGLGGDRLQLGRHLSSSRRPRRSSPRRRPDGHGRAVARPGPGRRPG